MHFKTEWLLFICLNRNRNNGTIFTFLLLRLFIFIALSKVYGWDNQGVGLVSRMPRCRGKLCAQHAAPWVEAWCLEPIATGTARSSSLKHGAHWSICSEEASSNSALHLKEFNVQRWLFRSAMLSNALDSEPHTRDVCILFGNKTTSFHGVDLQNKGFYSCHNWRPFLCHSQMRNREHKGHQVRVISLPLCLAHTSVFKHDMFHSTSLLSHRRSPCPHPDTPQSCPRRFILLSGSQSFTHDNLLKKAVVNATTYRLIGRPRPFTLISR